MAAGLSVVIPTLNEAGAIGQRVAWYLANGADEVVVSDGGSSDGTVVAARKAGARVVIGERGRARQLNAGARAATRSVLYFVHADTLPPRSFRSDIHAAIHTSHQAGCYRLAFDDPHPLLRFYAWFTRFNLDAFRFGDQTLFVTRTAFDAVNGFRTELTLMEDQDIVIRLRRLVPFAILPARAMTSARRYHSNGIIRLQILYFLIWAAFRSGATDATLVRFYRKHIRG